MDADFAVHRFGRRRNRALEVVRGLELKMNEEQRELPHPGLDPRPITLDEYRAFTPEKLELLSGYLIAPPDWPQERRRLLALLLVNMGLVEAVKLAPAASWRAALERAYDDHEHEQEQEWERKRERE